MKKIKDNYKYIIFIILIIVLFYVKLPFYGNAPGGSINITDRVEVNGNSKDYEGSLNMLYVSEYELTPATMLVAKLKGWDIEKKEERQISNESSKEINTRDKIMRDNSLDIATFVAYTKAGKKIDIKSQDNIVVATTKDNNIKIGDIINYVDDTKVNNVKEIKDIIASKNIGDSIKFTIMRDNKEREIVAKIYEDKGNKVVGIIVVTEYKYDTDPKINIKFKNSETGSSGGLMLTLTIFNAISDTDIIKGRQIAGTGTISMDGTVGEIDGIKYKIMGAAKDKMDIVFVPSANYKEAIATKNKYKYNMDIVKVDTFDEAVKYLINNP